MPAGAPPLRRAAGAAIMRRMTNYARILDPEVLAFVRRTEQFYPADAATRPIAEQRAFYDAMCRAFHAGRPPGVTTRDVRIGDMGARIYLPPGGEEAPAAVLYLHGGGFFLGGLESHDDVCAEICAGAGLPVVAADYRLCPEHPHPAAYEDALSAARWTLARFNLPLILAGDSAGGALAASAAHALRAEAPLAGMALIYPGLGGETDSGSWVRHAHAPLLTRDEALACNALRHGGAPPAAPGPDAAPLRDVDFSGLPPTVVFHAECDPLSDDGPAYAARILAAGGRALAVEEKGLVHGYLRARRMSGRAADAFARILAAIGALAEGRWPPLP
ncbi:acetyl esterase [Oceanicella actignis]|nr:acetyl esterase [Oceanicella actignis]